MAEIWRDPDETSIAIHVAVWGEHCDTVPKWQSERACLCNPLSFLIDDAPKVSCLHGGASLGKRQHLIELWPDHKAAFGVHETPLLSHFHRCATVAKALRVVELSVYA